MEHIQRQSQSTELISYKTVLLADKHEPVLQLPLSAELAYQICSIPVHSKMLRADFGQDIVDTHPICERSHAANLMKKQY